MIEQAIILSLQISAIFILFLDGMLLGWLRVKMANKFDSFLGMKWSRIVQKPIWDCLPCMSGLWTIALTQSFNLWLILMVCTLNALISKLLDYEGSIRS